MLKIVDLFDPTRYVEAAEYLAFWKHFFVIFKGWWPRILASVSLFFAFWTGVYRRRVLLGIFFFSLAIIFAYLSGILKLMGI